MINVSKMMGYLDGKEFGCFLGLSMAAYENDIFCNICYTGEPGCYSNKIHVDMIGCSE